MVSVISEKRQLENGDCSPSIAPPKYKRRKVSAIRDFPPGCGRHAAPINLQIKEVENGGKAISSTSKNVEFSGPTEAGLRDVEGKGNLERVVESQSNDVPVCSSSPKVTSILENSKIIEIGLPKGNPILSEELKKIEEEFSTKDEIPNPSKDLTEVKVESPSVLKNTSVLDLQEACTDIKSEVLVEGTILETASLPHHPIPLTVVWKKRKYPPRRRVSALRDFPPGCGHNMQLQSEVKDKHLGLEVTDASTHKEVVQYDENRFGNSDTVDSCWDMVKFVVSEISGVELEGQSEVVRIASPKVNVETFQVGESLEIEGREETTEVKHAAHHARLIEKEECDRKNVRDIGYSGDEVNTDLIVYVNNKNKKRNLIGVSCDGNESLPDSVDGVENEGNVIVVQGLMAASNCPGTKGKQIVKSSPSVTSAKRSKGKKRDSARKDKPKCSPNKGTNSTENLEECSKMIIPYRQETEIKEVSDVHIDEGDLTENEESLDAYQLVPRKHECDVTPLPFGLGSADERDERGARNKVRETLRLFHAIVRKLQQGDQSKSKDQENVSKRVDLRASNILKAHGKFVNISKKNLPGPVPGVEVGDVFNFRIELSIIGLHRPPQAGIDYVKQGDKIVATSIVASGGYANDVDSSDVLVYTGQGGNAKGGDKEPEDQKLERGNLALKNSKDEKNFVRVIRGFKETKSSETADSKYKSSATYTYDGLYTVDKYWHDIGPHGKLVYKFELRRVPGQPELVWKEMKRSNKFKVREGRCVLDISEGRETFAISAINTIDDEKPPPFTYITSMVYPDWCQPLPPKGCDCKDGCSDSKRLHCTCAIKNGGEIPYNHNGAIVEAKPLVYECGPSCKCSSTCHNRVSQNGIKFPLEIFKTDSRGWGVRSLSFIPSGSFICEYIGELLDDKEAEQRTGNDEYLFDIGQNYNDPTLWDGLSDMMPYLASTSSDVVENVGFTIDAAKYGNIGRFINHSCSPNLYAQNVLYDHEDKRIPHIMLFAAENIPPLQELTYHYNYTIDQVFDHDGNIKKKSCYCGSSECTGRLY